MKKLITFVLVFVMLSTNAMAAGSTEALKKVFDKSSEIYSGEMILTSEAVLNQPMELFNTIPLPEEADIDLRMLAESLTSGKTEASMSYSITEDFKKMSVAATVFSDSAIDVSDAFSIGAKAKIGMWLDYDFTDKANPVYKMFFN